MVAAKFRLQRADYNGCEGHLTGILPLFFLLKLFSMEIENFDKTRVKFLIEIKHEIFRFNSLDTTLKLSHLLAPSFEILVGNTQFSLALATSWSQFRTLPNLYNNVNNFYYYLQD